VLRQLGLAAPRFLLLSPRAAAAGAAAAHAAAADDADADADAADDDGHVAPYEVALFV